jgi:hypothetical protein
MATSIDIPVYNDSDPVLPISGNTPWGFYDSDPIFQAEGPKFVIYSSRKLGYPIEQLELQYVNFYQAFEEAVSEYGKELYDYKIRENYISMEGNPTDVNLNNAVITPSLGTVIRIADTYGSEFGVGGTTPYYTASLPLFANQQFYDLNGWASSSLGITRGDLEVKRIFFEAPPAIVRFFDPYAGTGAGLQSLMETFGFGQFSPGINFMLMPIEYDVLTIQAIEFNDQIRKSAFSFNIVDNQLRIFPIPTFNHNLQLIYAKKSERNSVVYSNTTGSVSNISNVPYTPIDYSTLNYPAKQWIFQYAACLVQCILGRNRQKYNDQIPGLKDQWSLNGSPLIAAATEEMQKLIDQLRANLEEASRTNQLQKKNTEAELIGKTLNNIPMPIYIG